MTSEKDCTLMENKNCAQRSNIHHWVNGNDVIFEEHFVVLNSTSFGLVFLEDQRHLVPGSRVADALLQERVLFRLLLSVEVHVKPDQQPRLRLSMKMVTVPPKRSSATCACSSGQHKNNIILSRHT